MASINWCVKMKNGLELVEPSENMSDSYLKMAEESLGIIKKVEESKIWTASASYYVMYYCLYSVMMKIGIKCEIHKCSIEFMKRFLSDFYSSGDVELIEAGFELRSNLQYYPEKFGDRNRLVFVKTGAVDFLVKTGEILGMIGEKQVNQIRGLLKNEK